ncbi:hypothetical protein SELMODRAFT_418792 [Selaginella moellendorffii]|uniref:Uncharacterized protein n=1 Tax=Selaginella moellendorffii TaxID=88036 RepID=D8S6E3_SELML|nr:hypothetical protein SELMODRAFT_418792 [Selaginella moellendorffii]
MKPYDVTIPVAARDYLASSTLPFLASTDGAIQSRIHKWRLDVCTVCSQLLVELTQDVLLKVKLVECKARALRQVHREVMSWERVDEALGTSRRVSSKLDLTLQVKIHRPPSEQYLPLFVDYHEKQRFMDALSKQAIAAYSRGQRGPFLVATNVPWVVYDAWMCSCDSTWRLEYRRGEVLAYGDPSIVHSTVSSALERSIIFHILQIPGIGLASLPQMITGAGASRLRTISGDKEPDACFFSGSSLAQPARAVLEVAYKNEPLEVLREVLDLWVESGCLVAIGVKIARPGDDFTFVARERGNDGMEIQFGPEFCNEQNRERFVVKFPVSSFTADVKGDYYVEFDLFWLQQYIFRMIEQERQAFEQSVESLCCKS